MRLIKCTTKVLEEVDETSIPPYAILSHRWESNKQQVLFQDFNAGEVISDQYYWTKIHTTCRAALEDGLNHVGIDTCCFDKSSSAETSESINSIFEWYGNAKVCYAYLFDFDSQAPDGLSTLWKSEWFYRGWTLQELIAPKQMQFYDCNWKYFGTRHELALQITDITGIDQEILCSEDPGSLLPGIPIARRMSWAAERNTSRAEDRVYSLLGLFGVNIPMLYGEGERAFIRLQEEILKQTTDLTIFAWTARALASSVRSFNRRRGVLAHSPSEFADAGKLVFQDDNMFNSEFSMTNKGLRIKIAVPMFGKNDIAFLSLNCVLDREPINQESLGIILLPFGGDTYVRCMPNVLNCMRYFILNATPKPVAYIAKDFDYVVAENLKVSEVSQRPPWTAVKFMFKQTSKFNYKYVAIGHSAKLWNQETKTFDTNGSISFTGFIQLEQLGTEAHAVIACGFDSRGSAWVCITKPGELPYEAAMKQNLYDLVYACTSTETSSNTCMIGNMGTLINFSINASVRSAFSEGTREDYWDHSSKHPQKLKSSELVIEVEFVFDVQELTHSTFAMAASKIIASTRGLLQATELTQTRP